MELYTFIMLVVAAFAAGLVDAVAGGGGLLTIPALLYAGLTPAEAIGTNKLQGTAGVATSSHAFWRAGLLDLRSLRLAVPATALGAALGSLAVSRIDQSWLKWAMPFVLIMVATYFAFAPRLSDESRKRLVGPIAFASAVAAPVGFYDGLFGPAAGSLYMLGFVTLAGLGLTQATASTKLLNFTSNVVSLVVFIAAGNVMFTVGLAMAAGQMAGAHVGVRLALRRGATIIRPLVVAVCIATSLKLLAG